MNKHFNKNLTISEEGEEQSNPVAPAGFVKTH